ncbi:MAG: helix-turn-helix transcriptional regulator [Bacteroidota bacterium]|nr:helix-turn-helix transcriptional regulator [Bacteroidota bacterium]
MAEDNIFAERFKSLREKNGLNQKDIALCLNISGAAVNKYEAGESLPTIENLKQLRKLFKVSLDYLLGLDIEDAIELLNGQNNNICEKIKALRMKLNYTQKDFAFTTDIELEELKAIESGKLPRIDDLLKMCSLLKLNPNELLQDMDNETQDKTERDHLIKFALDIDNSEYLKLAMSIKKQGLKPEETVIGKKVDTTVEK